jgi:hypothetical protein
VVFPGKSPQAHFPGRFSLMGVITGFNHLLCGRRRIVYQGDHPQLRIKRSAVTGADAKAFRNARSPSGPPGNSISFFRVASSVVLPIIMS